VFLAVSQAAQGSGSTAPRSAGASRRSTIAIDKPGSANGAIDLDGQFGLHPSLTPLMPLWAQGSLAFVHAAGSPDPTRSHFDGQDNIESGTPGNKATPDGWLNRLEGVLPAPEEVRSAPTRAMSVARCCREYSKAARGSPQ
jgi:uncharacterized protein (DUF1501 family)